MVKTFPGGGSQTTYFDASSNVLGYSDTFVDSETNATNTNYNDADNNWLGSQSSDPVNGFSNTYFTTTQYAVDGTTITGFIETGTSFFEKITPFPFKYVTLFFLNKNSTPFVST